MPDRTARGRGILDSLGGVRLCWCAVWLWRLGGNRSRSSAAGALTFRPPGDMDDMPAVGYREVSSRRGRGRCYTLGFGDMFNDALAVWG